MPLAPSNTSNQSTDVPNESVPGLIVICGATATGKSGLAIAIAEWLQASRLNSAIISADSRQVYREFNIGTAKPALVDQQRVPHYLIDICDPTETLTVADYQVQARAAIEPGVRSQELEGRREAAGVGREAAGGRRQAAGGRNTVAHSLTPSLPHSLSLSLPLLVGGTGLYIRAITRGMVIPRVPPQPELRSQLQALGQATCYAMLQQVDARAADKIHPHDQVRTLRSLEVYYTTGRSLSAQQGEQPPSYPMLHIGLDCGEPEQLRSRIACRAKQMVAAGFGDEVEWLCQKYGADLPLLNTLGYAEFKQYVAGRSTLETALEQTIIHTRQFAKRQRTWFRAVPEIQWFEATAPDLVTQVQHRIEQFGQAHSWF